MLGERIGRVVRALRHRRDWTQVELGRAAGCSGSVISRLENGNMRACSLATVDRIVGALGGHLVLYVDWRGGELDRLLDADHAALQERWAARKALYPRWESRQEVTYSHYGERGSVDDLCFDRSTGTLVVSELKSGLYDLQKTLAKIDEKVRLAPMIAGRLGWGVKRVVSCLVIAETRTNRRRVASHGALLARFDCRGRSAFSWLGDPMPRVGGLLVFVPLSDLRRTQGRRAGRQRVRHAKGELSVESPGAQR